MIRRYCGIVREGRHEKEIVKLAEDEPGKAQEESE